MIDEIIEKHARIAVLPVERQGDTELSSPEVNLLHNYRHILSRFAEEVLAEPRRRIADLEKRAYARAEHWKDDFNAARDSAELQQEADQKGVTVDVNVWGQTVATFRPSRIAELEKRIAELEVELKMWKPMTPEEAEAEIDAIEAMPIDEAEINEIVERVTDPTYRLSEPEYVKLAARVHQLQRFQDEVQAAIASEGPHTIEHLLAVSRLGEATTVMGRKRVEKLHEAVAVATRMFAALQDLLQWSKEEYKSNSFIDARAAESLREWKEIEPWVS